MAMNCLVFILFLSFVKGNPYVHFIKGTPNPTYLANFSASVRNDSEGVSCIDISANLKVDLEKVVMFFSVMVQSNKLGDAFDRPLFKGTIDACQTSESANFIAKTIFQSVERFSNIEFKCPRRKGWKYLKDFPVKVNVPAILRGIKFSSKFWEFSLVTKGRLQANKPMVHIYTVVVHGGCD